jgi:hypothetical protein
MMTGRTPPEPWHLDRKVPVAIILTVALQTVGIVWWAASLSSRVEQHAAQIDALRSAETARAIEDRRISEGLARLDERLKSQTEILQRLERRAQ